MIEVRCSACGACGPGDGYPPCKHFRRNREIGALALGLPALGPVDAFFVRRGLMSPIWPSDVREGLRHRGRVVERRA